MEFNKGILFIMICNVLCGINKMIIVYFRNVNRIILLTSECAYELRGVYFGQMPSKVSSRHLLSNVLHEERLIKVSKCLSTTSFKKP